MNDFDYNAFGSSFIHIVILSVLLCLMIVGIKGCLQHTRNAIVENSPPQTEIVCTVENCPCV